MSFMLLGILNSQAAGGVAASYWMATLGGSSSDSLEDIAFDSDNNSYTFGWSNSTSPTGFSLVKRDPDGAIQWQRALGASGSQYGYSVAVDSLDRIFVLGRTDATNGSEIPDFLIARYDSSGTLAWQRTLGSGNYGYASSIAIDSNNVIYAFGNAEVSGQGSQFVLAQYNSSGSPIWQRQLGGSGTEEGYAVAIDSADAIYVAGNTSSTGAGGRDVLIAKYNSSGTIQWQRVLGASGTEGRNDAGLVTDSSNNVYYCGYTDSTGAGSTDILIAKYNSSGTLQWQRVLGNSSANYASKVAIDSEGNIYVAGYTSNNGTVAKYDSSGTIQWQREIDTSSNAVLFNSLNIDSNDSVYLVGYTNAAGVASDEQFVAKVPNDGSLIGTYVLDGVNFTYQATGFTSSTSSLTPATSSLTSSSISLSAQPGTHTSSSASLTQYLVEL